MLKKCSLERSPSGTKGLCFSPALPFPSQQMTTGHKQMRLEVRSEDGWQGGGLLITLLTRSSATPAIVSSENPRDHTSPPSGTGRSRLFTKCTNIKTELGLQAPRTPDFPKQPSCQGSTLPQTRCAVSDSGNRQPASKRKEIAHPRGSSLSWRTAALSVPWESRGQDTRSGFTGGRSRAALRKNRQHSPEGGLWSLPIPTGGSEAPETVAAFHERDFGVGTSESSKSALCRAPEQWLWKGAARRSHLGGFVLHSYQTWSFQKGLQNSGLDTARRCEGEAKSEPPSSFHG